MTAGGAADPGPTPAGRHGAATLRVIGWNVREGVPQHRPAPPVAETLAADVAVLEPDVLALQEVPFEDGEASSLLDQVSASLGLRHRLAFPYSPAMHVTGARAGVALLARTPWRAVERCLLPNPGLRRATPQGELVSWDKGALIGCLRVAERNLWVGSVHLPPFHLFGTVAEDPRVATVWKGLADFLGGLPAEPLVLAADFNTERRDLLLDRLPERPLRRSVMAGTSRIGMAVDDVLYSEGLDVRRSSVHRSFSDHALCRVEFEVEP